MSAENPERAGDGFENDSEYVDGEVVEQTSEDLRSVACSYIPEELMAGMRAQQATKNSKSEEGNAFTVNAVNYSSVAVVPPSFEGGSILADSKNISVFNTTDQIIRPNRSVYDMQFDSHEEALPGVLMRSEGEPPLNQEGAPSVDACYDNLGIAFNFFHQVFGRNSIDNAGAPLIGIVNFGLYYPNATYSLSRANKEHVLVFGNGWDNDPWNKGAPTNTMAGMFGGLVSSLEVVVHELVHGITNHHVQLNSHGQPGALNEHLSDVFGIMAEQWAKNQTVDEADWLVGEDCLVPERKGFALRSFEKPGQAYDFGVDDFTFRGWAKDPQKSHYKEYFEGNEDQQGVHINSGILNKAFFLAAKALRGKSWETVGQVWYAALTGGQVHRDYTFRQWANRTIETAKSFEGFEPDRRKEAADAILQAWKAVGLQPVKW